jgi:hypothetical protein
MDRLRSEIEATRASISRTTSELRWKAGEAMQWQTYVKRHPVPILAGAALVGLVVGRRVAQGLNGGAHGGTGHGWTSPAADADTMPRLAARSEAGSPSLDAMAASWHRLGARVEGLVNRMIDDVADTAERVLLPAIANGVESFLAAGRPRPVSRSSYHSSRPDAEGRSA